MHVLPYRQLQRWLEGRRKDWLIEVGSVAPCPPLPITKADKWCKDAAMVFAMAVSTGYSLHPLEVNCIQYYYDGPDKCRYGHDANSEHIDAQKSQNGNQTCHLGT